jgi:hypothetical protein
MAQAQLESILSQIMTTQDQYNTERQKYLILVSDPNLLYKYKQSQGVSSLATSLKTLNQRCIDLNGQATQLVLQSRDQKYKSEELAKQLGDLTRQKEELNNLINKYENPNDIYPGPPENETNVNVQTVFEKNSSYLQLESLLKEIKVTQTQYETAYKNYITILNSSRSGGQHTQLPGMTYLGSALQNLNSPNVNNCEAVCSSNPSCAGASYNSLNKICSIYGTGELVPGNNYNYAIIKNVQYAVMQLQTLNQHLLNLNNKAKTLISQSGDSYSQNMIKQVSQNSDLEKQYHGLMKQKKEVDNLIKKYETLNSENEDATTNVNSKHLIYSFFWVTLIIVIYIFLMIFFNFSASSFSLIFILLLISLVFYVFGMLYVSAVIAVLTILYVILR